MSKSIVITWDDYQKFKSGENNKKVLKFWENIMKQIPEEYKLKLKNAEIYLDFQVNINNKEMKLNFIPYRFRIKDSINEINNLLDEYTLYVKF